MASGIVADSNRLPEVSPPFTGRGYQQKNRDSAEMNHWESQQRELQAISRKLAADKDGQIQENVDPESERGGAATSFPPTD